jgi:hypothetical protein
VLQLKQSHITYAKLHMYAKMGYVVLSGVGMIRVLGILRLSVQIQLIPLFDWGIDGDLPFDYESTYESR